MAATGWNPIGDEAADEISRLEEQVLALQHIADRDEAEIERLQKALQDASNAWFSQEEMFSIIRAALEGK